MGTYHDSLVEYETSSDENKVDAQFVVLALEEMTFRRKGGDVRWLDIGCGDGSKIRNSIESAAHSNRFFQQWEPKICLTGVDPRSEWKKDWGFPGHPNVASEFIVDTARNFISKLNGHTEPFDLVTIVHSLYEFPLSQFALRNGNGSASEKMLRVVSDLLRLGDLLRDDGLFVIIIEANESAFAKAKRRFYPRIGGSVVSEHMVKDTLRLAGLYNRNALSRATVKNKFYIDREHLEEPASPRFPDFLLQSATSNANDIDVKSKRAFGRALARYLERDHQAGQKRTFLSVDDAVFIVDMARMREDDIS